MSEPVSAVYRVICAWCQCVIRTCTGTGGDSHGICQACLDKQLKKVEQQAAKRRGGK